jgi:hypothetical protein
MAAVRWGQELAEVYDAVYAAESEPSALDPVVDLLAGLAHGGSALEFGVGTGRVALRLRSAEFASRASSCRSQWRNGSARSRARTRSP